MRKTNGRDEARQFSLTDCDGMSDWIQAGTPSVPTWYRRERKRKPATAGSGRETPMELYLAAFFYPRKSPK